MGVVGHGLERTQRLQPARVGKAEIEQHQIVFDRLQPVDGFRRGLHRIGHHVVQAGIPQMTFDDARVRRIVLDQKQADVLQFVFAGAHRRVLLALRDAGTSWHRHPGSTPHAVISACSAGFLSTGATLPPVATSFTYRRPAARLKSRVGGKFVRRYPESARNADEMMRQAYDESRGKNSGRFGRGVRERPPAVHLEPGALAALRM
jgi:hypothetical protein